MSVNKCSRVGCHNTVPRGRDVCDECASTDLAYGYREGQR